MCDIKNNMSRDYHMSLIRKLYNEVISPYVKLTKWFLRLKVLKLLTLRINSVMSTLLIYMSLEIGSHRRIISSRVYYIYKHSSFTYVKESENKCIIR